MECGQVTGCPQGPGKGCGKMKAKNWKKGAAKTACMVLGILLLPAYGIAWITFQTAVCRDNRSRFLEKSRVKAFAGKAAGALQAIRDHRIGGEKKIRQGKGFVDFTQEMELGKQWFFGRDRERITITSHDGLKLVAYYLPADVESDRIFLLMHGYRNNGLGDFSGLVKYYHELGYHLLVPHQRSHGESEGEYICYGVKERNDVKQWTEYLVGRFQGNCRIFLSGISMGAATVLMAAGLSLPEQVKGIVADCGFTSPWDIIGHVMKKECGLPRFPFLYLTGSICRKRAGFGLRECSTLSVLKKNTIPVLFIHGGRDRFVPTEMSWKNYEACAAPRRILIVDNAAHGTSHLVEPGLYRETVREFLQECLNNKTKEEKESR